MLKPGDWQNAARAGLYGYAQTAKPQGGEDGGGIGHPKQAICFARGFIRMTAVRNKPRK